MTARVIQHDLHEVACRCGRVHRAPAPPGAGMPGTVTYGISSLQAWCVYLMAAGSLPPLRSGAPARADPDRLELLTVLIGGPSFDPLYRPDVVQTPAITRSTPGVASYMTASGPGLAVGTCVTKPARRPGP
jgi:hypothetical protein